MNHVTTLFNSNEFGELRTIIIENEVYFVAKSVATALDIKIRQMQSENILMKKISCVGKLPTQAKRGKHI